MPMRQTADSITGAISCAYDGLDGLTTEATPQGSVSNGYDAASRRISMAVSGQAVVSYSYDNDNRVTQIAQGASNVALAYDADSRRMSLALPNGVTTGYNYDAASQLLGINYQLGNTLLGNLTYSYDLAGRPTAMGGSFARTGLPAALAGADYNANTQLTQFGLSNLTYDANGNLTSDGTHTYTWDARNRLVSMSGAVSASFVYDAFGRRVSKTIGAATTNYLYDDVNPVQELSGGSPTANLLTGLGVDEYFQRTDSSGPANFLTDALGSTIALTGPTGNMLAQYTYDPYGNTTASGASTNPYQYTGRENDGTGLYYYRARYYDATLGRFISEDPMWFRDGTNLYAYAHNSPANLTDPFGLYTTHPDVPLPLPPALDTFVKCMDKCTKREQYVSATTNGEHSDPGHAAGTTVDLRPVGTPSSTMFCCAGQCGALYGLDERPGYSNNGIQTKYGQGAHYHFQLVPPQHPTLPNAIPSNCKKGCDTGK
jgi:RHS repeat-associated protein